MQTDHTDIMLLQHRVLELEKVKSDMEERLRRIERNMYMGWGMLIVLQLILKFAK